MVILVAYIANDAAVCDAVIVEIILQLRHAWSKKP